MSDEEWDNVCKPVPFGDEPMEMAAFNAEGYEFVTALPAVDGCGEPWGTELFFKKRVVDASRPAAREVKREYGRALARELKLADEYHVDGFGEAVFVVIENYYTGQEHAILHCAELGHARYAEDVTFRPITKRKESEMEELDKPYQGGEPLKSRRGVWLPIPRPSGLQVRLFLTFVITAVVLFPTWLVLPLAEGAVADWWAPISGWTHAEVVHGYRICGGVCAGLAGTVAVCYWTACCIIRGIEGRWHWNKKRKDQ